MDVSLFLFIGSVGCHLDVRLAWEARGGWRSALHGGNGVEVRTGSSNANLFEDSTLVPLTQVLSGMLQALRPAVSLEH